MMHGRTHNVARSSNSVLLHMDLCPRHVRLDSCELCGPPGDASVATARFLGEYFSPLSTPAALGVETLATAVLTLAIFGLTDENNTGVSPQAVPALIGACIVVLICTFGPLTQAGMNPARDFSPRIVALVAGWPVDVCFQAGWWVYVVGPMVGAQLGAGLQRIALRSALQRAQDCGCEGTVDCEFSRLPNQPIAQST